jgi:NAD kinase
MFKKIILLMKTGLKIDAKLIENIEELSGQKDMKIIAFNDLKKEDLKESDLIITLGGDGTFVKAANLVENSPILGINVESHKSEGALTDLELKDIEKLKDLFSGKYSIQTRQRAKVKLNGKFIDEHALNEVYVGATSQFHSSRYKIKFKGNEEEHRSSGVIVSTGTGSPAWFYSAGGKIFSPEEDKLSFIVREPYRGKRIFIPKIIKGDLNNGEKLIIESTRDFGGIIAINDATYDFNTGSVVEIELSDKPLKAIKLK